MDGMAGSRGLYWGSGLFIPFAKCLKCVDFQVKNRKKWALVT